jgi:hypothetical protein
MSPRVSTPSPVIASSTATQVNPPIRSRSSTAANNGVATTYIPVMKPEMLAGVVASPAVCTIWATPYKAPRTIACRMRSRDNLPMALGETSRITTEAMVNRTARKSRTGTRSSRSWIRKNVDPQLAVIASRAIVARRVAREPADAGRMAAA